MTRLSAGLFLQLSKGVFAFCTKRNTIKTKAYHFNVTL